MKSREQLLRKGLGKLPPGVVPFLPPWLTTGPKPNRLESSDRLRRVVLLLQETEFMGRKHRPIDFEKLMNHHHVDVRALLFGRFEKLIEGLKILSEENPYGVFNRHDRFHIEQVNRAAQQLLTVCEQQTGQPISEEERVIATIIAFTHDLGNNLRRKEHSVLSDVMFSKLFTNYDQNDPRVISIKRGIIAHDEPYGEQLEDMADVTADNRNIPLRPILAVISADKLDVGRHRLDPNILESLKIHTFRDLIENVPHTLIVLYAASNNLAFSEVDGTYYANWDIEFSTDISKESDPEIRELLRRFEWIKPGGIKSGGIAVPEAWHQPYKNNLSRPYSDSYLAKMMELYHIRMAMLTSSLNALLPNLSSLNLSVSDTHYGTTHAAIKKFSRENGTATLFNTWKNINQEEYRAGKIEVPPILSGGEERYYQLKEAKAVGLA